MIGAATHPAEAFSRQASPAGSVISQAEIALRRFDAKGNPLEDPRVINTVSDLGQEHPRVEVAADGSFLVVWQSIEDDGGLPKKWVRSQAFDSDGVAMGSEQLVSQISTGSIVLIELDVAALRGANGSSGGFVVTWNSVNASVGTDTDDSIQARIVTGPGTFDGDQIQFNVWETNNQEAAGAHGWYGRLSSAWRSIGNDQNDTSPFEAHITGRDIEHCLFCDDFEWFDLGGGGNLWRWSGTAGGVP